MKKNTTSTYDTIGQIEAIRQSRRQKNANRPTYLLGSPAQYGVSSNLKDWLNRLEDSGSSWYEGILNGIRELPEDIPNVLRMTLEKRAKGFISEKQEQLRENETDLDALDLIKEYREKVDRYKELLFAGKRGSKEATNILARIDELDSFFKSEEGRSNPIIAEIMYDKNDTSLSENLRTAAQYLVKNTEKLPQYNKNESILGGWKREFNTLYTGFENTLQGLGNALMLGVDAVGEATGLVDRGTITRNAIQSSSEGGMDLISDKLYIGMDVANRTDLIDKTNQLYLDRKNREAQYSSELDVYIDDFNNGNVRLPFSTVPKNALKWFAPSKKYETNAGWRINDAYDPEDVSQEWRDKQEQLSGSVWHPVYMIPEIGSTLGMIEGMIGSMGVNVAAEAVINKLPSLAVGGKKYELALKAAYAAGDMQKVRQLLGLKEAYKAGKTFKAIKGGIRTAEVGTELGITTAQRVIETNQEAMDAASSRLQKMAAENGADMTKVFRAIFDYEAEHGVDVSRLSATDLIGEALAKDIKTDDPVFEQAKKDSQKGLTKLINANNALAVSDYLQTLPFLSYGEKILSKAGKRVKDAIFNNGAKEALSESDRLLAGAYDGYIDHLSKYFIKDGKLMSGLAASRIGKYAWDKTKKFAPVMAAEGYEEGVQTTLQQRFESGEYDNYRAPYSQFSMSELLQLPELDMHVTKALFGLNGTGDDEIRKSVVIGAFVGSIFPAVGSAVSNLRNDPSEQNLRNLLTQLKNDKVMTQLISNDFHDIGDEKRIRTFIESFHKTGVSAQRLAQSLYDIKGNLDQNNQYITPDMVDEDLKLLDATNYMYNNKKIQDLIKKHGIDKYSKQHKDIITTGAKIIADRMMAGDATEKALEGVSSILNEDKSLVDELFQPGITEERKELIYAQSPELKRVVDVISNLYESYHEDYQKRKAIEDTKRQLLREQRIDKYMAMNPQQLLSEEQEGSSSIFDLAVDQLIHDGELKDRNVPKSAMESIVNRALKDNNFKRGVLTNYVASLALEQIGEESSKEDYIKGYLNALYLKNKIRHAKDMLSWINDKDRRNKEAQAITGLDIDTETLGGMTKGLESILDILEKKQKEIVSGEEATLDDVFSDELKDLKFDKQDDLDSYIKSELLNLSLHYALTKLASAYVDPSSKAPGELNEAMFGDTYADSFLIEHVKNYEEKKALIDAQPISRKKQGRGFDADEADLSAMREQAAWDVINRNLTKQEKERSRIVRRFFNDLSNQEDEVTSETQESSEEAPVVPLEDDKLEQALTGGEENAERLEQETMNLTPEEVERRKRKKRILEKERARREQEQQEKDTKKTDDERAKDDSEQQEGDTKKTEPTVIPFVPQEDDIKSQIDQLESTPDFGGKLIFTPSENGPVIIKTETILYLSDGQIIGKIEENGQTYYYVISRSDYTEAHGHKMSQFKVLKYDKDGNAVEDNNYGIELSNADKWNVDFSGIAGWANTIVAQHSDETNTPVQIRFYHDDDLISTADVIGTESIGDENTKDPAELAKTKPLEEDPQIDEYEDEDNEVDDVDDEDDEEKTLRLIDQVENEKLEKEYEQEQAANKVANEAMVNNSMDISSTEDGKITIGGIELDPFTQELLIERAALLYDVEMLGSIDQNDLPNGGHKKSESQSKDEAYDYVSDVFFYRPDAEELMKLRVDGKDVKLRKTLKPGSEFSKKLIQKGWLENCYNNGGVYYIVTQAADAARNKENRSVDEDADTFTVTLIVEDPNEDACYACSLRQLGKYTSLGTEKDPITGEDRRDGENKIITREFPVNHEKELRDKLSRIHTVYKAGTTRQKTFENEKQALAYNYYERLYGTRPIKPDGGTAEQVEKYLEELDAWQKKVDNWANPEKPLPRWHRESTEHYQERVDQRENALRKINQDARFNLRQVGKTPMTDEQINEAIDNLRKERMTIIDAYLTKDADGKYVFPKEIRTDVVPEVVTRSNGRFNNQKTASGAPVLKNVSREGNPFGVKQGVSEINQQIQNGEVRLGIGSGALRTNNIDAITDFREGNESTTYTGKGLAGKVFIIVKSANNTDVPVMLVEQKLNQQHDNTEYPTMIGNPGDGLKLCIDPFTGEIIESANGTKPSAAEAILYMLFGRLSSDQFVLNQEGLQQQLATLIVNNGIDTLLNDANVEAVLPYYAAKQLAVINGVLHIGMPIGNGQYRMRSYTQAELFDDVNQDLAAEKRTEVIRAIANQMHWNTDKQTMNEKFGGEMTNLIAAELERYFQLHPEQESFTVAGVEEFTFNKKDLFEVDNDGKPTRIKRNMTMAAWLLHTGKLSSDIGDTVFKDPFVFGNGVKVSKLKSDAQAADAVLGTGDIDLTRTAAHMTILNDESKMNSLRNRIGSVPARNAIHSEQEYIDAMIESERAINSELTQQHGPAVRVLALDLPILAGNKPVAEEDLKSAIADKLKDIVENVSPESVGVKKLSYDDSTYEALTSIEYKALRSRSRGFVLTARIFEDGHIRLQAQHYVGRYAKPEKGSTYIINGVYQSRLTGGTFDAPEARKWLHDKLGLNDSQVFISNAFLRGTENQKIFAVTNIAFDNILQEVVGRMMINPEGGAGSHYHESFHYVNLLLHSPKQRIALYEDYVKSHPKLRGADYSVIEEEMAEDFREWAERENSTKFSDKIKRFFSRIGDMLIASRRKSQYRSVFKAIQRGEYKNTYHLDKEAVKEFMKEYPTGVPMMYIPTLSADTCSKLSKTFNNAVEFYQVSDAIVDFIINESSLNTPKDIIDLAGKNFKDVITKLRQRAKEVDETSREMILAFVDNPEALQRQLMNRFDALGIIVKEKRLDSKKEDEEDPDLKEDSPDNIWDKFQFTISKKDSVALKAKLFLRLIPSAKFILDDDGEKILQYEENEIIPGCMKYTLYDVAWNQIVSETNHCTSYGVLDESGNYPTNSFRGIVKRAAKASAFFKALDEKLDEIDYDSELKTQIYSAVNSQKPNIYFHEIQAAKAIQNTLSEEDYEQLTDEDIQRIQNQFAKDSASDRMKQWVFRNDNALQAVRNIPKRWADSTLLSGIIDDSKNTQAISEAFVNKAVEIKSNISSTYNEAKKGSKKNKTDWTSVYVEMTNMVCDLCNHFGIIMDSDVIDYFVNTKTESQSYADKAAVLRDSFAKNTAGTIGNIVALLNNNIGESQIIYSLVSDAAGKKKKRPEPKPLEKLFSGTRISSDISKLALAYHAIHPSSSEFGVMGPNKEMLYPSSQNNMQSAKLRNLNTTAGQHALDMMRSPYARHSIMLNTAKNFDEIVSKDDQFSLNLEVGLKDATSQDGKDFFGITALEDYIQKMLSLDQDPDYKPGKAKDDFKSNEATYLVSPTMADKKTHYTISSKNAQFKTSHAPILGTLHSTMLYYPQVIKFAKEMYGMDSTKLSGQEAINLLTEFVKTDPSYGYQQFDKNTIERFAGYVLDELETLELYYKRENIEALIKDPNKLKDNYHGSIKGGRMDFSGNGGKFRYFYDLESVDDFDESENETSEKKPKRIMNLNQKLEWLYDLEKDILLRKLGKQTDDPESIQEFINLGDIDPTLTKVSQFDGFELVRNEIKRIKEKYFDQNNNPTRALQDALNRKLFAMVDAELYMVSTDQRFKLCEYNPSLNVYIPTAVPAQLLSRQNDRFVRNGVIGGSNSYIPYRSQVSDSVLFYSLMANHVANTFTSIIEFEKVFSSDPAFYKWKDVKGKNGVEAHKLRYELPSGEVVTREYYVSNVGDKFSDKIKRLGSVLSPGDEMRLDLSEYERLDEELNPGGVLNSSHYSVLVIDDISAKSQFLDSIIKPKFKNNLISDYIRHNDIPEIKRYIELRKQKDDKYDFERLINEILDNRKIKPTEEYGELSKKSSDNSFIDESEDYFFGFDDIQDSAKEQLRSEYISKGVSISDYIFNLLPKEGRAEINKQLDQQSSPYADINVSDAQVFVRPQIYRKIRISLGQWSTTPDENGYSDEAAYWLLENDPDWQSDPEKAAMVSKLLLFPLKMSYVANENEDITGSGYYLNVGTLDKAAYFPLFKYTASNETGKSLYDRMNRKDNEIDMVAFVSAVKVGAPKMKPSLYDSHDAPVETLGKFNDIINHDSDTRVKYDVYSEDGSDIEHKFGKDLLPVQIQDLSYLRYQLNTRAHEASERKVGSQMAKLCYSNIIDKALYGRNKSGQNPRTGLRIKMDVTACINALTELESAALQSKYYTEGHVNKHKVHTWLLRVTSTNGLGAVAEQIMQDGVAECLDSRVFFEQTIASAVGKSVVDINMNGGTAVQQSMIGFNDYDGRHAISDEDLINRNNLLQSEASAVFEFSIKDDKLLEKHNIKTVEDFLNSNLSILDRKDIKDQIEYLNLHVGDKIVKGFHKINGGKEIKWHAKENSMQVILSMNFFKSIIPQEYQKDYNTARKWLLDHNIIGENAKPFGAGYRIPTQGMSSIFAFQVADVLPEQSGDLIIVPREFTAQTGSDFDVDKLYLATFAYEKVITGEGDDTKVSYERSKIKQDVSKISDLKNLTSAYKKESIKAVQNQLLQDFIDVISDDRNYSDARASIDTITNLIQKNLLSWLKPEQRGYLTGMMELLPSFQSLRKEEFKVGKDGIAPFALNAVNVSLTQLTHLSLNYDVIIKGNPYGFGHLDEIDGEDGMRISAWLSAMINANVDVAKDPYVFVLNAIKATYNYVNFLLRAGKGITTFTFLTQPILIDYATLVSNAGGMYGQNLDGTNTLNQSFTQKKNKIKKSLKQKYINIADSLMNQIPAESWKNHKEEFTSILNIITAAKYYNTYSSSQQSDFKKQNNNKPPKFEFNKKNIFNYDVAKALILNFSGGKYTIDKLRAAVYLLCVMEAFEEIEPCADAISELVHMSQIDTKKFGNSIVKMQNFENRLMDFIYNPKYPWIIRGRDDVKVKETDEKVQEPTATLALEEYFKHSFLWDKFQAAKKHTLDLASGELLSATKPYKKLFELIAMEVNGTMVYKTPAFEVNPETKVLERAYETNDQGVKIRKMVEHTTFKPFLKEETIQTLSTAINNVMRFNILMNVGPKVLGNDEQLKLITDGSEETTDGPIDFTYGGDYVKTVINISRLLFGNGVEPSLPIRIKNFVTEILNDPNGSKAEGLVENGKIVNKFLLYLNPIPATQEVPIDRLNLNESAIRTSKEIKPILSSYWDQLLNHSDEEVRKLARDIVLYSYYTTYDTQAVNNITDIIPPAFRTLYDRAITNAVRQKEGIKLREVLSTFFGMKDYNSIVDEDGLSVLYYDIVARNYWYDDDIVRRYTEHGDGKMNPKKNYIEYRTAYSTNPKSKQRFAGMIVTSNLGENAPLFMKIVKKNDSVLYRRVGLVEKINKKGKNEMKPTYVYLAVQKAGLHVGKTHLFEFFKSQYIPSMFEWNMLPGQYNHKLLLEQLNNNLKAWSEQSGMRYKYIPQNEINIPLTDSSKYDSQVYKEIVQQKQRELYGGSVSVDIRKTPVEDAKRMSELIIKFVRNTPENKSELPYSEKTVYVDVTDPNNLASIFTQLEELKFDKKVGMGIYVEADESLFEATNDDLERHMNELIQYYTDEAVLNNLNISDYELQQYAHSIRNEYEDYIKIYSRVKNMSTAINIVFQAMISNEYSLQRVYTAGMNNVTRATINAYEHNIDSFSTRFSYMYIDKEEYKKDSYDDFIESVQQEIKVDDMYVTDSSIKEEMKLLERKDAENLAKDDPFGESFDDDELGLDLTPKDNKQNVNDDLFGDSEDDDILEENVMMKEVKNAKENTDEAEHAKCNDIPQG